MSKFVEAFEKMSGSKSSLLYGDGLGLTQAEEAALGFTYDCVEQRGGEGQGDDIWAVYKVIEPGEPDRYYKADGWYASYAGCEFSCLVEVEPVTVSVVQFKEK